MLAKKWLFVGLITVVGMSLAVAAPPAVHPTTGEPLVIDCLRGTPDAIDGDLSDWNLAAMTPAVLDSADQIYTGTWGGPQDCSGKFYVLWDDTNVYIAAIIKDDLLSMDKTGGDIWNADCVEVFFGTTNAIGDHTEHYQWGFNANGETWNWEDMEDAGGIVPEYMQYGYALTADGYTCEVAIPYAEISSLDWSVGNAIGFHPCIDDTEAADREIQMTWTGREAHDQSLGFGQIILSDERAIAKELARNPQPENGATDMPRDAALSWEPGAFAVAHDVYFGTIFDDVNNANVRQSDGRTGQPGTDRDRLRPGGARLWRHLLLADRRSQRGARQHDLQGPGLEFQHRAGRLSH